MNRSQLLNNRGNVEDVKTAVKNCTSRKDLRLALQDEREHKNRKTVIEMLEKKLKA